ncbi:uncharacterized protein EV422DRAFT_112494 [Fimicolochytrium jonesii]|uniref:uncharacterized protein n=1 Tax=Fimicolochytrium jonesii TaxID=1396493 RepID=UPI0022FEE48C|nr:uncharacterized protein EV422DRAFT_112494 [Fimicolochytrium jonesii]KAI8819424.1 hypothetical protein EV422DRAFT_112494 [Fimicolochytrium jonesii]
MAKNSAPNLICIGVAFLAALFYVVTGISDPSIDPKIDVRMVAMDFALLAIVALAQGQLWLNKKWAIGSPTMISVSLNTLAGLFLSTSYVFKFLARWTVNLNREALVSWMYRRAPTELVVTWDALMALHTVFYHKQLMIIWYFGLFRLLLIFIVFRDVFDWVQYEGALQLLVSMTYIFGLYQRDRRDRLSFAVATGKVKERGPSCTTSVVVESRFTLKALKAHLQSIWTSAFADTHKEENFQSYFATVSKKAVRLMSVAMMTSNVVSTTNLYFRFKGHRMADTDFIVHTVFAVTVPFICIFSFACTYMAAFGGKHLLRQQRTLTCAYALLRIGTTVLCICAVRCIPGYLDGTMNVYQVEGYEWHVYISILFFHYNAPVSLYGLDCLIGRYGLVCSGVDVVAGLLVAKWGNADGSPLLPITQLSMALFAGMFVLAQVLPKHRTVLLMSMMFIQAS